MALQRRRLRSLLPLISAISGAILFFFALLSFLPPTPMDSDQFRRSDSLIIGTKDAIRIGDSMFHIPSGGGKLDRDIWSSRNSKLFYGCCNASSKFAWWNSCFDLNPVVHFAEAEAVHHVNRFLAIATSGGLHQQRTGIVDAVVAARILNATLVVPKLDQKSFWKDARFSHSYAVKLAIQLAKFDYRLVNKLDTDMQKLRRRVNYHALRFTDPILRVGKMLVNRMRLRSKHYIALHVRFEPDMLAFSGCDYGGGEKERTELGAIHRRWKTLHVRLHIITYKIYM